MSESLLDIQKTFTVNPGGMREINMSLVDDIASMKQPIKNVIPPGFRMMPGKLFHRFYFTLDSCKFSEAFSKTVHGKEFTATVSFVYPSPTPEAIKQMDEMTKEKFVVIASDNKGQYRVIGNLINPATFTYNYTSENVIAGLERCECMFTAKLHRPAYFYGGNFDKVVFNSGFTYGFLRTK
jgi:hypothetical protein